MANRYWVGGTANWDGTAGTKWASTSGGAGGQAVPTSADDVFFDAASTGACAISAGNTGAKSINCTGFTGTLSGSGAITVSGSVTLSSGMSYSNTSQMTINATGTLTTAGKSLGAIVINVPGGTVTLGDALTVTGFNGITLTAGTFDLAGFNVNTRSFNSSNSNTRAIAFGSSSISLTSTLPSQLILSMGNTANFTYTGTGNFVRNSIINSSIEVNTSANLSGAMNLFVNNGSSIITFISGSTLKNLDFTGSTCIVGGQIKIYENLTLSANANYTLSPTFIGSGTVTCSGRMLVGTTINGAGITVTANGDFISSGLTLTQGTFNANNYAVNLGGFSSNNSNTRTLNMGTGTWTITGVAQSGANAWNVATSTGFTIIPSTSTITMTSASEKTFSGGGLAYYNLNQGGAGALTISGSNTFNNITNSTQPATITFTAGTTQTVSNFGLSGTAGNLITINSATSGSQFTLSKASGTVTAQYLAIQDSNATGGATWDASSLTNTDLGNNTGWVFPSSGAFMMFF
jgi:hypothetical protein